MESAEAFPSLSRISSNTSHARSSRVLFFHRLRHRRHQGRRSSASPSTTSTSDRDAIRAIRLKKVEELRSKGLDPYAYEWNKSHGAAQLQDIYRDLGNGEEKNSENDHVSITGRIVARRAFGKLAFFYAVRDYINILYCDKERLIGDQFEQLKAHVDIGDIFGVRGTIKRTEKENFLCLCYLLQSLQNLCFHCLKNIMD